MLNSIQNQPRFFVYDKLKKTQQKTVPLFDRLRANGFLSDFEMRLSIIKSDTDNQNSNDTNRKSLNHTGMT